ncbi:hypothetical protein [Nonomuraea sp. NPDC049695]|uniref:hypothetical protein n=1 Tax=Nonomuraea sp. NPDC049695 TaxID=3154734 RepID=UPI00342B1C72
MIPFRQAVRAWLGISLQTFGGPAGQIAVMQRTLIDDRGQLLAPLDQSTPEGAGAG